MFAFGLIRLASIFILVRTLILGYKWLSDS